MTPLEHAKERLAKAESVFIEAQTELSKARWAVEFEEARERIKQEIERKKNGNSADSH